MGELDRAGAPLPLRTRRLQLLDRALREAEEPGVLEMTPETLATLESRLFAETGAAGEPDLGPADGVARPGEPPAAGQRPVLRLIRGGRADRPVESPTGTTSEVKRSPARRLRLLRTVTR